jgi:hypothetical protein
MTRARTLRLTLSLLLTVLAVAVGGLSVHRKVQSFQPLGFEAIPVNGGVEVVRVQDPGTGLREGDLIALTEVESPLQFVKRLREQPESTLVVQHRGGEVESALLYQRPPLDIDFPFLIQAVIGAAYLAIGLFTLLRQKGTPGFLFYLWCLVSAAMYLLAPVPPVDLAFKIVSLVDALVYILLPALTLHLFLVFPTAFRRSWWSGRLAAFLYLPAAALAALELDLGLANGRFLFGKPSMSSYQALVQFERVHFIVFALAAVALLVWRLATERSWEPHRQMKWVAFGVAGGYVPFLLFYYVPLSVGVRWSELVTSAAVLPLALVPLAFAWAILRYKLWDLEVIVRDAVSWTLTLVIGLTGFSLINLAISRGVSQELAVTRNLLSFVAGLAIAGLLVPTRSSISSVLERFQYGETFGKRRALLGFGRELLLERDLSRLCGALLSRLEDGMALERANLYLAQGGSLLVARTEPDLPARLGFDALGEEFWGEDFLRLSGIVHPSGEIPPSTRLFVAGYRYAFPLNVRGRGIGVALVGFKRDETPLNSEDVDLIRALLNQASLAVENAQLVGQLHVQLEDMRRLQHYTEGIFESSPAGIAVIDGERRLVSVNSAFVALAGLERDALIGRDLTSVLPVTPPAPDEGPVEASFTDASGTERHLQLSLAVFEPERREGLHVLVVHDVSERVAMEVALKEKDRLAALGMLAAGVAHEVNTPITGISSYAQMLLSDTPPGDPHYEILKKVERQTFRAARIVNNLLEFARNRQKERQPVALAPLVTECLDLLSERFGKRRIELDWTPPERDVVVLGCDGELQQVFTNLILNALDAMSETGGRLSIALEQSDAAVTLRIRDSGPGIPPEKLEMIFQPFYSTKLNRGGTGLGLSISYDIVQRHGGDLRVVSAPGEGACFLVELPRFAPPAATA